MKKKILIGASVAAALLLVGVVAHTQVPPPSSSARLIPYHGFLQDGAAPADGAYDFAFSIYPSDDPGDAALWTERQDSVDVVAGNFSVALGEGDTTAGDIADVWASDTMYLGIELCERTTPASP